MFNFDKFYYGLIKRTDYLDDYLDKYPQGREKKNKERILKLLRQNIHDKDAEGLASTIATAYLDGADEDYTDLLLYLLDQKWHTLEEDIIGILELAKDPKSIEVLYKTATNIPDYDEGRSVAKKCIWALGAIHTEEAKSKILALRDMGDSIISEAASLELQSKIPWG